MPEPRRVVVCSNSAVGHARPMLAVADAFVRGGWEVRILTGSRFGPAAAALGASHVLLPSEGDLHEDDSDDRKRGLRAMNEGATAAFLTPAPAGWAALRDALDAEPADAVVADATFVGACGLASLPAGARPLDVRCGVFPLGVPSVDAAPFGLGLPPAPRPVNRIRNRLLTWLARRVLLAPMHREAERTLALLGAPALAGRFFMAYSRTADLIAQFTVPEFEYPRFDLPANVRFYGPVARSGQVGAPVLPSWWDRLDGTRPVVHVSQGTVANRDYGELIGPTLAALGNEDVTIVVTTGGPPVAPLPPLPPNALAAEFVPHHLLLPKTDVFVTNGGYGAIHVALEHGVPMVVAGDTEEKPECAARVAWSGAGIDLRKGRPGAKAIRRAVRAVLADQAYAGASARIGAAIRRSPGADGLVRDVEAAVRARVPV